MCDISAGSYTHDSYRHVLLNTDAISNKITLFGFSHNNKSLTIPKISPLLWNWEA